MVLLQCICVVKQQNFGMIYTHLKFTSSTSKMRVELGGINCTQKGHDQLLVFNHFVSSRKMKSWQLTPPPTPLLP